MTEPKTKFEIEPAPVPAFDFAYIVSHWLVLDNMPLGLIPLGEAGIRPQAVWFLELIELEEEWTKEPGPEGIPNMIPSGELGIRVHSVGGGEVELDSDQSADLETVIRLIESKAKNAGHRTSTSEMIDMIGKPPAQPSVIAPPWAKK